MCRILCNDVPWCSRPLGGRRDCSRSVQQGDTRSISHRHTHTQTFFFVAKKIVMRNTSLTHLSLLLPTPSQHNSVTTMGIMIARFLQKECAQGENHGILFSLGTEPVNSFHEFHQDNYQPDSAIVRQRGFSRVGPLHAACRLRFSHLIQQKLAIPCKVSSFRAFRRLSNTCFEDVKPP